MIETALIADDEPLACERINRLIQQIAPEVRRLTASDGDQVLALIRQTAPDVVLLDIEMPGRRGFEIVREIGPEAMPITIFVTAYDRYTLDAFECAALDYLLKPVDEERFAACWERARQRLAQRRAVVEAAQLRAWLADREAAGRVPPSRLFYREAGGAVMVPLERVTWIEASGNHVVFHLGHETMRVRETLIGVERRLAAHDFVRVHRRFLVRIASIREIRPWSGGDQLLVLESGTRLPISRNYRPQLEERLNR
jgi:two-component system LytT family response regulator